MFLSFLLPFAARGQEAAYLWVLYKQITHFTPQEIAFIASASYFQAPEHFAESGRWDISPEASEYTAYQIPTAEQLSGYARYVLADDLFASWQADTADYGFIMRRILTERSLPFEAAFRQLLTQAAGEHPIEAVLTWCNVPSVLTVAKEFCLPVIHSELGPLRGPCYHWTAYFDFSGVNGNTESRRRFEAFCAKNDENELPLLSMPEMRRLFVLDARLRQPRPDPEFAIGLPLQVENDTNIIAFADGWDNERLMAAASAIYGREQTLIRRHPGGLRDYPDSLGQIDHSENSIAFIQRCARIATINSSVGLEAMLFERETFILGDNPCAIAAGNQLDEPADGLSGAQRLRAINFLLFAYLIPYEFLFDPAYLRWRLQQPNEVEIYRFHRYYVEERERSMAEGPRYRPSSRSALVERGLLKFWQMRASTCSSRLATFAERLTESERQRAFQAQTLEETISSRSWKLTRPLRWLHEKLR